MSSGSKKLEPIIFADAEERNFWERVFLAVSDRWDNSTLITGAAGVADRAVTLRRERLPGLPRPWSVEGTK
jgi:hypothetical protein